MMEKGACGCPHHKVKGTLIVLLGLVFLLGALDIVGSRFVDLSWPVLLILAGLFKLSSGMCKCCDGGSCGNGKCC